MGRRWLIALALLPAGCGATPPQAPDPQAHELDEALSAFSTACGHAAEIQAFSDDRREMTTTEHQAQQQIPQLVKIYRQNSDWVFQGKTVAELVAQSVTFLDECGLHESAQRLRSASSSK